MFLAAWTLRDVSYDRQEQRKSEGHAIPWMVGPAEMLARTAPLLAAVRTKRRIYASSNERKRRGENTEDPLADMSVVDIHLQLLLRLLIAMVLGSVVGYERERRGKPAGVRTHGMVSLGAALFAVLSIYGFGGRGDPARLAAQIVTGIGFVGAGAILHQRRSIQGLTTAASLWVTAALGLAVGVGMISIALEAAILVFLLLRFGPRPGHTPTPDEEE